MALIGKVLEHQNTFVLTLIGLKSGQRMHGTLRFHFRIFCSIRRF